MRAALLCLALCACASGPRPLPASATAAERLEAAEAAVSNARDARVSFVTESKGLMVAQLTGTLDLYSKNVISLSSEGQFGSDQVHVELDTKNGDQNRSLSKGASVSNHKEPIPTELSETLGVTMVRMGLLHTVGTLTADQPLEHANGGVREWARAVDPKDLGPETSGEVPCHRVEFSLVVEGKQMGSSKICIADATGLPVDRTTVVKAPQGEMTVTERYAWSFREAR